MRGTPGGGPNRTPGDRPHAHLSAENTIEVVLDGEEKK